MNTPLMSVCVPFAGSLWRVTVAPIRASLVRKSVIVPDIWENKVRGNNRRMSVFMIGIFDEKFKKNEFVLKILFCKV